MAEMYFRLVVSKRRTCNPENTKVKQVPSSDIEAVRELLTERGYDYDGNKI